jgi:hypothetical protein
MIINGNDRMLWIKRGEIFQPVGCLTSNGMDEDTEMLPTTTRNNQGWRTSIPQLQGYTINFEGLQLPTLFRAESDNATETQLRLTIENTSNFLINIRVESVGGWFIFIQKIITPSSTIVATNPSLFVLKGANTTETATNIATNLQTYNNTSAINYSSNDNVVIFDFTVARDYEVTTFLVEANEGAPQPIATYVLNTTTIPNPSPLLSYDRMRLLKRLREKITWRIMSAAPIPQYIDEGEGYITAISETSPVNEDATYSGTITGWGVPRVIKNDIALGSSGDFIETDGNLIEP